MTRIWCALIGSSHMYTYGYEARHAERPMEAEAPVCSGDGAGADRLMRRSLRYGTLPIYLLPRKAPVFDYTTACHIPSYIIYTLYSYVADSRLHQHLLSCPVTDRRARYSSQPAAPCSTTRKHLQPQQTIDGYVQNISLIPCPRSPVS